MGLGRGSRFVFDAKLTSTVDSLRGAASRGATIRRAIALYGVVLKATLRGDRVVLRDRHGQERDLIL